MALYLFVFLFMVCLLLSLAGIVNLFIGAKHIVEVEGRKRLGGSVKWHGSPERSYAAFAVENGQR